MDDLSISIELMRNFSEVARCGSISQAAEQVGLTQPALSSSIKKLEHQLKTELFHRSKKGVLLTRSGQIFLQRSSGILRDWQKLTDDIAEDNNQLSGLYSLGIHSTLASVTLDKFLPGIMHENSELTFSLLHSSSKDIMHKVLNLQLDFGIVCNQSAHPQIISIPLFSDQVMFYQPKRKGQSTARPGGHNILLYNEQMFQCEVLVQQASAQQLLPHCRELHLEELSVIASLVAAGMGYGILPKLLVDGYYSQSIEEVPNTPVYTDNFCLIMRRKTQPSAAALYIKEYISKTFRGWEKGREIGLGLARSSVLIRDADPGWQSLGAQLCASLKAIPLVVDAQHIGSTAVPDLVAKPILDIALAVEDFSLLQDLKSSLAELGLIYRGLMPGRSDHLLVIEAAANVRTAHVHLVIHGGKSWCDYLAFRDKLLASAQLKEEYRQLKLTLALQHSDDRERYTLLKSDFIQAVLQSPV